MKTLLPHILKGLMIIVLIAFIGIVIFTGMVWAEWPMWVGFFIAAGILGIFLAAIFFYKLFLKRKEQKFVSRIIEQENLSPAAAGATDREASKEMQEKWKAAMDALKQSHLDRKSVV